MRLTSLIYPDSIVHGPYFDKGLGRNVVNIQTGTKRGNMTYARYLMQEHLGRKLLPDEHVDHKNDRKLDDWIENLQVLDPPANTRKTNGEVKFFEFTCPECGVLELKIFDRCVTIGSKLKWDHFVADHVRVSGTGEYS